jgi:hypothetical protein
MNEISSCIWNLLVALCNVHVLYVCTVGRNIYETSRDFLPGIGSRDQWPLSIWGIHNPKWTLPTRDVISCFYGSGVFFIYKYSNSNFRCLCQLCYQVIIARFNSRVFVHAPQPLTVTFQVIYMYLYSRVQWFLLFFHILRYNHPSLTP